MFPATFAWGAATASFQTEGGRAERGECVWDRFCRLPGKVRNADDGDIACDHYHRWREDVALMRDLGLRAYRFSLSWPRILPNGRGTVNAAGLDFYDRLVDELLTAGIEPYITLNHWDLPQALEEAGGWPNRDLTGWYLEYVQTVAHRLGDRVRHWITHNEPWLVAWLGYGRGIHAPGRECEADAVAAAHHLLLSHGQAVSLLQREYGAQAGITLNIAPVYPATESAEDEAAAYRADGTAHRWFLGPLFRGSYPADILPLFEPYLPIQPGDMETIATPADFLGINTYSRRVVRAGAEGQPVTVRVGEERTALDWEVYPAALRDVLLRLQRDYAPPAIYVTENGAAMEDVRRPDGQVLDPERCSYLERYIAAMGEAVFAGVPVAGYFVWSLLDNFEWTYGFAKRFGLVYVDYPSGERVPKASYGWYRDFIRAQPASAAGRD